MTDPQTTNLADRAEAAGESETREVLLEAWWALNPSPTLANDNRHLSFVRTLNVKAFESAALMLVPEGYAAAVGTMFGDTRLPWACIWTPEGGPKFRSDAATLALALTAACLRAEAARRGGEGG